jgi:hypothetical protein
MQKYTLFSIATMLLLVANAHATPEPWAEGEQKLQQELKACLQQCERTHYNKQFIEDWSMGRKECDKTCFAIYQGRITLLAAEMVSKEIRRHK